MPVCTNARPKARQRCTRIGRGRTARRTSGDRMAHESQKQSTTTARGPRLSDFPSAMSTNTSCATKNDPTTSANTTTRDVRMLSAAMSPTWDAGSARATGAGNHTGCAARPRDTTIYPHCLGVAETRPVPWCHEWCPDRIGAQPRHGSREPFSLQRSRGPGLGGDPAHRCAHCH